MKLLHLSDLHIGKSIGSYSLLEDQKFCLEQILKIIEDEKVDIVLIAGDIFDTAIPNNEAMKVYSDFVDEIIFNLKKKIIAISGNHDSGKRLEISKSFFEKNSYYIYGNSFDEKISFDDEYGKVNFYPIPYISLARAKNEIDSNIENFTDLYKVLLKNIDYKDRNVLISHCYANEKAYEDEKIEGEKPLTIGGNDAMDAHLFKNFDYVALGHLHRKHFVLDEKIRYCGTFMKYSFSEINQKKSLTLVDLKEKISIKEIEIKPLNDFKIICDYFENILKMENSNAYIEFTLKDDNPIDSPMAKLKMKFPHAVSIKYEKSINIEKDEDIDIDFEKLSSMEIFEEFYKFKMNEKMTDLEKEILKKVIQWSQ